MSDMGEWERLGLSEADVERCREALGHDELVKLSADLASHWNRTVDDVVGILRDATGDFERAS